MQENQTFDFKTEVRTAFNDFAYLRRRAVFVDVQACTDSSLIYGKHPDFDMSQVTAPDVQRDLRETIDLIRAGKKSSSCANYTQQGYNTDRPDIMTSQHKFSAILIDTASKKFHDMFDGLCPPVQASTHELNHETAHALVPFARHAEENTKERVADSFGGIQHLIRFDGDTSFLAQLGWQRAYRAFTGKDCAHFTSHALDQLMHQAEAEPWRILPKDTLPRHAEKFAQATPFSTTTQSVTEAVSELRHHAGWGATGFDQIVRKMRMLSSSALATSNKCAFYVGTKVFQPFLAPEGAIVNGTHIRLKDERRSALVGEFAERAAAMNLAALAAELADNREGKFHFHAKGQTGAPIRINMLDF